MTTRVRGMARDRIACVDFDGVLRPWGALMDRRLKATPGSKEALERLRAAGYWVVIFTSRLSHRWLRSADLHEDDQRHFVEWFLDKYDIPFDEISAEKVPAQFYIDDRAITFRDDWEATIREIGL